MIVEPGPNREHQTSGGVSEEAQIQALKELQKQLEEDRARLKTDEAQQRDIANRERDAAARERDAAARERQAVASEAAQLKNERQRLAEEAAKQLQKEDIGEGEHETQQDPTASQLNARAKKELRAIVDRHRLKHQRGLRVWLTLSVLMLHLVSLLIGFAIFLWKSPTLHAASSSPFATYLNDIILGTIILAVIFLLFLLEYMRNRRKHKKMLTTLDKIVVDLTKPDSDLSTIRTNFNTALDKYDSSFL